MTYIKSYKELIVWQKSMQLVKEIFVLTKSFPKEELYGLVSQMKRAAIGIPSNIAEGYGRKSTKSYIQFLLIAYGSALELDTQLILAKELKMAPEESFKNAELLLEEVCKMLNSMINNMKKMSETNTTSY